MGSASHESFVLRWNEFQSNIASCFRELRDEEDFFDVTLACDEEHQLQAHRVILAASSGFFRGILKRNPTSGHPVLVMPPNVRFHELVNILDFIYHGEVTVPNDELNGLLRLANLLKVKGLVDEKEKGHQQPASLAAAAAGHHRMMGKHSSPNARRRPEFSHPPPLPPLPPPAKKKRPSFMEDSRKAKDFSEEDLDEDDLEHIESDYMDDFPQATGSSSSPFVQQQSTSRGFHPTAMQQQESGKPSAAATAGPAALGYGAQPKLVGLKCPQCPAEVSGVEAFREHLAREHGKGVTGEPVVGRQSSGKHQQQPRKSKQREDEEGMVQPTVSCDICDKVFKNQKNMLGHQKRIHHISRNDPSGGARAANPTGGDPAKKRGRPKKKVVMSPEEEAAFDPARANELPRPVGQVQPAPRQQDQSPLRNVSSPATASDGARGLEEPNNRPPGPSGPRGPQRMQHHQHLQHSGGRPYMSSPTAAGGVRGASVATAAAAASGGRVDLKSSLGLKFGGHISISTSSNQSPRRGGDAQGVSITKMKGDGKDRQQHYQPQHRQPHPPPQPAQVDVKEEPEEEEEGQFEEEEEEEDYDDEFMGDEDEYGDYGVAVDGLYAPGGAGSAAAAGVGYGGDSFPGEDEEEEEEMEDEEDYEEDDDGVVVDPGNAHAKA